MSLIVLAMAVPSAWSQDGLTSQARAVPDEVAYTHLFLTLANNDGEQPAALERRRAAYIKHIGLTPDEGKQLLTAVEEFQRQETERTARASLLLGTRGGSAQVRGDLRMQLEGLRQDRNRSVVSLMNSLLVLIGPDAADRVRAYVNDKVKPNIRFGPRISE